MHFNGDKKIAYIDFQNIRAEEEFHEGEFTNRNREMIIAIAENNLAEVEKLLSQGVDLNIGLRCSSKKASQKVITSGVACSRRTVGFSFPGRTPVMHACIKHRPEVLDLFLSLGEEIVDLNVQDRTGNTALMFAAKNNISAVQRLTQEPPLDLNIQNSKGQTALLIAANSSTAESVNYILEAKADPNICDEKGCSPLFLAADAEICELLLNFGANVNIPDELGRTALIHAAKKGFAGHVHLLLQDPTIDVNHRDTQTCLTAFELAVWKNNTNVVKEFLASTKCPSLLRPMKSDRMGRVRSFYETAKKRKNTKMKDALYEAMKNEFRAILATLLVKPKLNMDIITIIASYSV